MIAALIRMFRRRNSAAEPAFANLKLHEGCTVMIHDRLHPWNGKAGMVMSLADPEDMYGFIAVRRDGDVNLFLPSRLSTRLTFAFSYERAPNQ